MSETKYFPTVEAIDKAAQVLDEILEPTPFQRNANLSDIYEAEIYLKREDLQMVRSYKIRGAYNKIRTIDPEDCNKGRYFGLGQEGRSRSRYRNGRKRKRGILVLGAGTGKR